MKVMNTADQLNHPRRILPEVDGRYGDCHINRKLLPMKAHFFLFFGSFAGVGPALILSCSRVGMSLSEIGTLYATLPFVQFVSKTFFGVLVDKYRKHKEAFLLGILFMGVLIFSINFLPMSPNDIRITNWSQNDDSASFECRRPIHSPNETMILTICNDNQTSLSFSENITLNCNVSCNTFGHQDISTLFCDKDNLNCLSNDNARLTFSDVISEKEKSNIDFGIISSAGLSTELTFNNKSCLIFPILNLNVNSGNQTTVTSCHLSETHSDIRLGCRARCSATTVTVKPHDMTFQYLWIWISLLLSWCAFGIIMSTADTIILYILGDNSQDFGKTRLFGSFGWGLVAPIVGLVIDLVSEGKPEKDYSPGFYLFAVFMLINFLVNIPSKVSIPEKSEKLVKDVLGVFRQPTVILMGIAVFANGLTTGFLWTFLIVYVNELSGGQQLIIGLNYAVECFLSEIPFFAVSGWVVSQIGHSHAMTISLFCNGLKTFLYSLLYNAWYILGIALLHGVTYGMLYTSMVTYIGAIAPHGTSTTMQGIFQGIYEGVGAGIGNLLGGYAYQNLGGRQTFMILGLATMAAAILHLIAARILNSFATVPKMPRLGQVKIQLPPYDGSSNLKLDDA